MFFHIDNVGNLCRICICYSVNDKLCLHTVKSKLCLNTPNITFLLNKPKCTPRSKTVLDQAPKPCW